MQRQRNASRLCSGGPLYEWIHSGFIHIGIGSVLYGLSENWAAENGKTCRRKHIYLMFPAYEVTTVDGRTIKVVDYGRLTARNDPEVGDLARKNGGPDKLLREVWGPSVLGIAVPGDYWRDYAPHLGVWIEEHPDFAVTTDEP